MLQKSDIGMHYLALNVGNRVQNESFVNIRGGRGFVDKFRGSLSRCGMF